MRLCGRQGIKPGGGTSRRAQVRPWALIYFLGVCAACAPVNTAPAGYVVQEKAMELASGKALRYTLALPPPSSLDRPRPLIVALHYGGKVTPYYGKPFLTNLILPALGELAAIMVAPDCPGETWTEPLSEEAVLTLIRQVEKDFSVDPRRLVLTGFSLGAIGTWKMALGHPETFSAAIPISGMPPRGVTVGPVEPPFLVIHSLSDEIFPLEPLKKFIRFCEEQGLRIEFHPVPGLSHYGYDAFVPALREAVPWVKSVWRED
jgi:dipeptidyl aminopeptidase/acylaminoacyl peptidase